MFCVKFIVPSYASATPETFVLGNGTMEECCEMVKTHIKNTATKKLNSPGCPEIIVKINKRILQDVDAYEIIVDQNGIVLVNGISPECEFYTITKA